MDAHELHSRPSNLLDKIAADPGMINRPAGVAPGELTAPAEQLAATATSPEVVLLHPDEHLPAPVPAKGHKLMLLFLGAGIFLLMGGGGAAAYFVLRPAAAIIPALATPTPTAAPTATPTVTPTLSPIPSPSVSPSPSPSTSPSPNPSPSASPTPSAVLGVTAPSAAPTAEHPQVVTVTNASGLWLRSTPSSASKKNIIAWMPKGAQVSVDQAGGFWWHGTYNGKSGYFAVSYTN